MTLRLTLVIVCLTAIAVARVHLRRSQLLVQHELQDQAMRQIELRRTLWDQQVQLGYRTAPQKIRQHAEAMSLSPPPSAGQAPGAAGRPGGQGR